MIAATPMAGAWLDRDRIPANTEALSAQDVANGAEAGLLDALDLNVGGLGLDHAQGNPFQPNLVYRGFEASPLAGDAQGLAVYVDGGRFNLPFGDTVNWDLIPDDAIDTVTLQPSNPVFGLNALGGALSVRLKTGFSYQGAELELAGGTLGSISRSFQYGAQSGRYALYVAGRGVHDHGWRDHSPSDLRQLYADLGRKNDRAELHLGVLGADNRLVGNGTSPVELLAARRAAVFTYPDETRNRFGRASLSATYALSEAVSIQAVGYFGHLRQRTRNGDAADAGPCDNDRTVLCLEGDGMLTDTRGAPIPNWLTDSPYARLPDFAGEFADGGPYAQLNRTSTDTDMFGISAQATWTGRVLGMKNQFVAGASYDGGRTGFAARSEIGGLGLDRGFVGPGIVIDLADGAIAPVSVRSSADYSGVFVHDTLAVTDSLSISLGGRFNRAAVDLEDRLGTALDGRHRYQRFNPQAGATYRVAPSLTVYVGYSEASRAPTPAELSCADPGAPCSLTNFFVGDPPLQQVTARTVEAGLRGRVRWAASGSLAWRLGVFSTTTRNDIALVASDVQGRGYFRNVGRTRRQGLEAGADVTAGRLRLSIDYAYLDAAHREPLTLSSPDNPFADGDGLIFVKPGDSLPGIPRHRLKARLEYDVTERLRLGLTARFASGQYLVGDEANQAPRTAAYAVIGASANYRLSDRLELFVRADNLLDSHYETFGTFSPTADVPIVQVPGASDPRSLSPAPPFAAHVGIRLTL
ncbi:MAG: TonB-dependent receptor [Alphaproteobacteria bacterium]|nr:TonB-dependent receptor [Alphaproteobacteria bacterium]